MKLTGIWAAIETNTGLPLEGRVKTINAYCKKYGYTIEKVYYDGPDSIEAYREFKRNVRGPLVTVRPVL